MSIASVATLTSATTGSSSSSSSVSDEMDKFLTILLTQLQTQSPLDPVDATEFTSQLAQYSSLEQQMNTNDKLDSLISALNSASSISPLSYLGNEVTIDSATTVIQDGVAKWSYNAGDAASVTIKITDASGNVIHTETVTDVSGTQNYELDFDSAEYDGVQLTMSASATDSSGESLSTSIASRVVVDAVDSSSGSLLLEANGYSFSADLVDRISTAKSSTSTADSASDSNTETTTDA